ncbi:MAG: type II toxin-antitoxin system HicA family toxin [Gemmataceae bacterium]
MKMPRNTSGADLVKALAPFGYTVSRRKSSHIRLTTQTNGEHHVTVPDHDVVKIGTLNGILRDVAAHLGLDKDDLAKQLFGP